MPSDLTYSPVCWTNLPKAQLTLWWKNSYSYCKCCPSGSGWVCRQNAFDSVFQVFLLLLSFSLKQKTQLKVILTTGYNGIGEYHILPHIFEDVLFRTSLAAEPPLLNTIAQVAEGDSRPSLLEILLDVETNLLRLRHLQRKQSDQWDDRKFKSESEARRDPQVQCETRVIWQGETGERPCNQQSRYL